MTLIEWSKWVSCVALGRGSDVYGALCSLDRQCLLYLPSSCAIVSIGISPSSACTVTPDVMVGGVAGTAWTAVPLLVGY